MKLLFAASFLVAILVVKADYDVPVSIAIEQPSKCSCSMPTNVQSGYEAETTPVFKAEAVEVKDVGDAHYTYTVMRVKVIFRGCPPQGENIIVKSPSTADACGVTFTPGTVYLVSAKLARSSTPPPGLSESMEVYSATSCSCNKEWLPIPYDEKSFLYYSPPTAC